jgi:hypothetical protein
MCVICSTLLYAAYSVAVSASDAEYFAEICRDLAQSLQSEAGRTACEAQDEVSNDAVCAYVCLSVNCGYVASWCCWWASLRSHHAMVQSVLAGPQSVQILRDSMWKRYCLIGYLWFCSLCSLLLGTFVDGMFAQECSCSECSFSRQTCRALRILLKCTRTFDVLKSLTPYCVECWQSHGIRNCV